MNRRRRFHRRLLGAALALCASGVHADGLADLRAALARLQGLAPLKAALDVKTLERRGEGKDLDEKSGQASVTVEDGARGLQVTYAKEMLARMDAEAREQARDPKARTPTLWALARLDSAQVPGMLSAATRLARRLDVAIAKGERVETWQGRPARVLSFEVPVTTITEQQRKYVKSFDATLDVWIAADGTPLASAEHAVIAGRAFVVISFEARQDEDFSYGVVGDRLLTLRRELHLVSSGAGERGEQRVTLTLQPQ